jgi:REP element-mobilizing transposase RayT
MQDIGLKMKGISGKYPAASLVLKMIGVICLFGWVIVLFSCGQAYSPEDFAAHLSPDSDSAPEYVFDSEALIGTAYSARLTPPQPFSNPANDYEYFFNYCQQVKGDISRGKDQTCPQILPGVKFHLVFYFFCGLIEAKRRVKPLYIYMRKLRILQQGVWYEISTLINNREQLFGEKRAREIFEQVFRETERRFTFGIQGLSFEGDLLRFYIRPEDGLRLPEIMKWMKQTFAQRYNRATGRTGHIWGDRYWSRILEGEPPGEPLEGEIGGRAGASANGDRPPRGKNEAAPGFPPISPRPAAPATG